MIGRNDPCWCGSSKKWKHCHFPDKGTKQSIPLADLRDLYFRKYHIVLKNEEQIKGIRRACQLTSEILEKTCARAQEGVTTEELNDYAHRLHVDAGAIPAPLNYGDPPFPKSICTSLNEVICHGIPDKTQLTQGDIMNIDVSILYEGYYGDCSKMVVIGKVSPERQLVLDVAYDCLMKSISILRPGIPINAIGETIESYAKSKGCSVVNQFVGHGIGMDFHESGLQIPQNFNKIKTPLSPGMTFTIEPMIKAGVREAEIDPINHWTAYTRDRKASGQWEHTVLITEDGHDVLTTWKR
jgi:methionyl aminopeptidase